MHDTTEGKNDKIYEGKGRKKQEGDWVDDASKTNHTVCVCAV